VVRHLARPDRLRGPRPQHRHRRQRRLLPLPRPHAGTKTDGETPDLWFRLAVCFRKTDGRWAIVHEHESVPFYMDGSFKAAVDLQQ
jgi:SnoaL-like protein